MSCKPKHVLILSTLVAVVSGLNDAPLVLLMSFDGLRYDLLNENTMPFTHALAQSAVSAPWGIEPQMWTVTLGNYVSIATGLYQESHGVIGNSIYDPEFDEYFDYFGYRTSKLPGERDTTKDPKWLMAGEPLWQLNERQPGHKSAVLSWYMCEYATNGKPALPADRCIPFARQTNLTIWKQEIDQVLKWFLEDEVNFVMLYVPEPDEFMHTYNIDGPEVAAVLRDCDLAVQYLFESLKKHAELESRLNLIMLADHGHTNTYMDFTHKKITDDAALIEILSQCKISEHSVFPPPGMTPAELASRLKATSTMASGIDVLMKEDLPEHWHYKHNRRIGPVLVLEKLGYFIVADKYPGYRDPHSRVLGMHGYSKDYPEMRSFFVAHGPLFKRGYSLPRTPVVQNIDIYPLIGRILGFADHELVHNGSFARIAPVLAGIDLAGGPLDWLTWTEVLVVVAGAVSAYVVSVKMFDTSSSCFGNQF